jgi:hypothetical protein
MLRFKEHLDSDVTVDCLQLDTWLSVAAASGCMRLSSRCSEVGLQFLAGTCDREMLNLLYEEYGMPFTETVSRGAAEADSADILQWLLDEKHCPLADDIETYAAAADATDVLQCLRARGSVFTAAKCMAATRSYSAVRILQYLRSTGCDWDSRMCVCTAYIGDLPLLQWLRAQGCPWDENTVQHAAMKGHMHIIKWAHNNGCPCNVETMSECAASGGSVEVLLWIKAKDTAAWTSAVLSRALLAAAANCHLDTAKASFIDKYLIHSVCSNTWFIDAIAL